MINTITKKVVAAILCALCVDVQAQQCQSDLGGAMIGYKTPNIIDNAIHITYSFADANGVVTTPSDDLKTAVQNALSEWSTTGVPENWVFDPAPPGYDGDIQILPSSDNQKS